jgi:hypothetical protein
MQPIASIVQLYLEKWMLNYFKKIDLALVEPECTSFIFRSTQ